MRKFDKKQRNTHKRNPKPVIAIVTEGENVTETQYFNSFNTQHSGCIIKIVRAGGKTDPEKLLAQLDNYWKSNDLDSTLGDKGFVVLDLDCDYNKAAIIRNLKNSTDYDFIVSNPCFEVWFILHFIYSTHAFSGSNEVLKTLEKNISGYSKTKNVFSQLEDKMENAIANSDRIAEHFDSLQMQWPSEECNPRTDVGMLVELILQKSNRDNLKNE